jgi:hypothetical protein
MSKVISIGPHLIGLDTIFSICHFEEDVEEWVGNKGKIWWNLFYIKTEYVDGFEVWHAPYSGRYITRGRRKVMRVTLTNTETIKLAYDQSIIDQWVAYKDSRP